ncbi:MAG: electron transport complex subunit RsxC [Proteobacteria bacterium]|nr:electron transport complex subunit RsxC [Pseudomonadota bacterium]
MITVLDKPVPFGGGIHVPPNKAMSLEHPLKKADLPDKVIISLRQHVGVEAEPVVHKGDKVYKGQTIARPGAYVSAPIHASTSGTVVDIADYPVPSASGHAARCIVIESDGKDEWFPDKKSIDDYWELSPTEIHNRILESGIVGMGGAGFPSAIKLIPGLNHDIELLILNAAECEPYISCDEALICAAPEKVINGLDILRHAVQAHDCVIGIEENMPDAIEALNKAIDDLGETSIEVRVLPAIYPAGGERQLIKSVTGIEVPSKGLPVDIGIVCYNVGTAMATHNAVMHNEPLISRVVTVTGEGINQPCNLEALIGTPISDLIKQCGGLTDNYDYSIVGGPMMGFALHSIDVPVIKTTNCILNTVNDPLQKTQQELPCIRCDECAVACPASLMPQQLLFHAKNKNYNRLEDYKLFDCIECGCCSYVCPSHIPLVQYYRNSKSEIWEQKRKQRDAEQARQRYLDRETRLQQNEQKKENKKSTENISDSENDKIKKQAEIAEAVERIKTKREKSED